MGWIEYLDGSKFGGECVRQRSLEDLRKELDMEKKAREGKWDEYGVDGKVEVWRRRYVYRGVPYEIAMLKYFSFNEPDPLNAIGMNNIGAYCVLEYVDDSVWKEVHQLLEELELKECWLWEDTVHLGMENWTIPEMVEWLHKRARKDIDFLLDDAQRIFISELQKKIDIANRLFDLVREGRQ